MTDSSTMLETALGPVRCRDEGDGPCVLFVHGSPGGDDQGSLMTRFLRDRGWRTVAFARPGYHGTPLRDDTRTPDAQAALATAVMDALDVERFALMCWSGGGPTSYRLAATQPDRVTSLVAIAAVSGPFEFEGAGEEKMLMGRFGAWLMKEMVRHTPKETVKSLVKQEGKLDKDDRKKLVEAIWNDEVRRQWALDLMETIVGDRKAGFENDLEHFKQLDLGLEGVSAKVLLVHAKTDADVPFAQSEHSLVSLPHAELVTIDEGTHVSVWTDPDSNMHQERIAGFLVQPSTHSGR
jgi:pimeloyl-ACP methyl ester carboxylesterase